MSKRFVDSGIFADSWFMNLTKDKKILWLYIITNCDHAGILELNTPLVEFMTGVSGVGELMQDFGDKIIHIRDAYYFIPGYIKFQYNGELRESVNAQRSAIRRLEEFGLWDGENGVLLPGKGSKSPKGKKRQNGAGKAPRSKRFVPPTVEDVKKYCDERKNGISPEQFVNHYDANGWMRGKNKIKDWKACVRTWEQRRKEAANGVSRAPKDSGQYEDIF